MPESMPVEVLVLALAGLLQAVQYGVMAIPANRELGMAKTFGPRDHDIRAGLSPTTGRLIRALNNHFEGLIMFTLAVVVLTLGNQSSQTTEFAAWTYLTARVLYIPAYAFGLSPWRSMIWFVGFAATIIMLLAALI
jgi:uncharacterized MAPEG superfamily protein